jgi:hypothetical protein
MRPPAIIGPGRSSSSFIFISSSPPFAWRLAHSLGAQRSRVHCITGVVSPATERLTYATGSASIAFTGFVGLRDGYGF